MITIRACWGYESLNIAFPLVNDPCNSSFQLSGMRVHVSIPRTCVSQPQRTAIQKSTAQSIYQAHGPIHAAIMDSEKYV